MSAMGCGDYLHAARVQHVPRNPLLSTRMKKRFGFLNQQQPLLSVPHGKLHQGDGQGALRTGSELLDRNPSRIVITDRERRVDTGNEVLDHLLGGDV